MKKNLKAAAALTSLALAVSCFSSSVQAQEMTPALKELVAAANKEREIIVTWSADTLGGAEGEIGRAHV